MPLIELSAKNERWNVLVGLGLVVIAGLTATLHVGDRLMMAQMSGGISGFSYAFLLFAPLAVKEWLWVGAFLNVS